MALTITETPLSCMKHAMFLYVNDVITANVTDFRRV